MERGLIGLDDDVSGHLPELAKQPIISANSDGSLHYEPAKTAITLRHLLTHTVGLCYDAQNPLIVRWRKEEQGVVTPLWKSGNLLQAYGTPRLFEAGESWQYGSAMEWVGLLVSRLNGGVSLGEYMEKNIFAPLGATDSTFHPAKRPELEKRRLEMVMRTPEGGFVPAAEQWLYPEDAKDDCGGLGLFSTVPDLIKVFGDLASKTPVLLSLRSIELMFTPQFESHQGVEKGLVNMKVSLLSVKKYSGLGILTSCSKFMYENLIGEGPINKDGGLNLNFGIGGIVTRKDTVNLPKNTLSWGGMPHLGWFVNRDLGVAGFLAGQVVPPGDAKCSSIIGSFFQEVVRQAKQT